MSPLITWYELKIRCEAIAAARPRIRPRVNNTTTIPTTREIIQRIVSRFEEEIHCCKWLFISLAFIIMISASTYGIRYIYSPRLAELSDPCNVTGIESLSFLRELQYEQQNLEKAISEKKKHCRTLQCKSQKSPAPQRLKEIKPIIKKQIGLRRRCATQNIKSSLAYLKVRSSVITLFLFSYAMVCCGLLKYYWSFAHRKCFGTFIGLIAIITFFLTSMMSLFDLLYLADFKKQHLSFSIDDAW